MTGARAVEPVAGPLDAVVRVPGSKSLTNRALVAAALSRGTSRLEGVLFADDTEAMLDALTRLGIELTIDREHDAVVVAGDEGTLALGPIALDARLSGTTSRFLLPVLSLGVGPYALDGAAPLRSRPMADGIEALRSLGIAVRELDAAGHLPVVVGGGDPTPEPASRAEVHVGGDVSSQFLSGLLLMAPCRPHGLTITIDGALVSRPYVELTRSVMHAFGASASWVDDHRLEVEPDGYRAADLRIEPDASAASYFFAAAAIAGGRVRIDGLGSGSAQGDVAFVDALEAMGAEVERTTSWIEVRRDPSVPLRGIDVDFTDRSDTAQTLAVVAAFADAPTTITGIGFIRFKETDRIGDMVTELGRCGITADELDDGIRIHPGEPHAATVQTYDDHRMAMSLALLGLRVPGIEIADPDVVAKTFPTFWSVLDSLTRDKN